VRGERESPWFDKDFCLLSTSTYRHVGCLHDVFDDDGGSTVITTVVIIETLVLEGECPSIFP
jgi:hypothetical protein